MPGEDVIVASHRDREVQLLHECRFKWFRELGFTHRQAVVLADLAADHHDAEDLLDRGCPIHITFDLLT